MENNIFIKNLMNGHELSDDALDTVAGGVFSPEEVELAKQYLRNNGYTEEQINQYEKQAKDAGLI